MPHGQKEDQRGLTPVIAIKVKPKTDLTARYVTKVKSKTRLTAVEALKGSPKLVRLTDTAAKSIGKGSPAQSTCTIL